MHIVTLYLNRIIHNLILLSFAESMLYLDGKRHFDETMRTQIWAFQDVLIGWDSWQSYSDSLSCGYMTICMCGFSFFILVCHVIFIYFITRRILHECKIFFSNFKLTSGEDILGNGVFSCLRVFFNAAIYQWLYCCNLFSYWDLQQTMFYLH